MGFFGDEGSRGRGGGCLPNGNHLHLIKTRAIPDKQLLHEQSKQAMPFSKWNIYEQCEVKWSEGAGQKKKKIQLIFMFICEDIYRFI